MSRCVKTTWVWKLPLLFPFAKAWVTSWQEILRLGMAAAEVAEDALAGGERNLVWELEDHAAQDLRGARGMARNPGRRAGSLPAARGADQALSTAARQAVKTSGWREFLSQPRTTRGSTLPSRCMASRSGRRAGRTAGPGSSGKRASPRRRLARAAI